MVMDKICSGTNSGELGGASFSRSRTRQVFVELSGTLAENVTVHSNIQS